jgi:hypothetical protein
MRLSSKDAHIHLDYVLKLNFNSFWDQKHEDIDH